MEAHNTEWCLKALPKKHKNALDNWKEFGEGLVYNTSIKQETKAIIKGYLACLVNANVITINQQKLLFIYYTGNL